MARPEQGAGANSIALPTDPLPWRPVDVFVTRDVSFNLEKMTKITAQVLGRLGCPNCHSGRIIHYHTLEQFVVNPKSLEIQEVIPGGGFGG